MTNWVTRHKLTASIAAACVVVIAALSVMTSGSGNTTHPAAPQRAPSFSLPLLGGSSDQKVALSQYAGKPLIVNFWASWCSPCRKETPLLATWYRQEKGRVALVGLDENDTTAAALKFAKAKGVTYPLGFDPSLIAADAFRIYSGIPQTFFLNAKHQIVDHIYGAVTSAQLARGLKLLG